MSRNIVIFGNGIGRALHNDFFSLATAMRSAWDAPDLLTEEQKDLIRACLPEDVLEQDDAAPSSEAQLANLQRIVSACDEIVAMEAHVGGKCGWLSPQGQQFPRAIRTYLHQVANYFLEREALPVEKRSLSAGFSTALREYVLDKGSNVVTLNYDDLLYDSFNDTDVFRKHRLRDGFLNGAFQIEQHDRWIAQDPHREGWFLHLHGSPLFLTRRGVPQKLTRPELRGYGGFDSAHLVLTNVEYKSSIIEASEILREYWKRFRRCCENAQDVLVIGYGGGDDHLNETISKTPDATRIRVVERRVEGRDRDSLATEWSQRFDKAEINIVLVEDVMDFRDFAG